VIKAIIFDCFGVLASDGWLPFKKHYFKSSPELSERATALNKAVDAGQASYDEFVRMVAKMAKVTEAFARKQIECNVPDRQLFAYIEELRQRYRIGLLSNAGDNWLANIFTPEQVSVFNAVALSYETGVIKPNIRAYVIIAERLGVRVEECVFVDDQLKHVNGAKQAGMQAVLYTNAGQLREELSALLTDP
jgi:HAD superfamily hydrolase (TIGR01509 family)